MSYFNETVQSGKHWKKTRDGSYDLNIGNMLKDVWNDWTGKTVADKNIAFQKSENEITRKREDNAIQRRVADLKAAGLSPTLAAGSPAQSAQLQAPQSSEKSGMEIADNLGAVLQGAVQAKNMQEMILTQKEQRKQIKLTNDFMKHDLDVLKSRPHLMSKDRPGTFERIGTYLKGTPVGQSLINKVKDITSSDFNPAKIAQEKRIKKAKIKNLLKLRKRYSRYKKSKKYRDVVKQLKLLGVN